MEVVQLQIVFLHSAAIVFTRHSHSRVPPASSLKATMSVFPIVMVDGPYVMPPITTDPSMSIAIPIPSLALFAPS